VLEIEPQNSRATAVRGLALYQMGRGGSAAFLIAALGKGESFSVPAHLYIEKDKKLLAGVLMVDRRNIRIDVPSESKFTFSSSLRDLQTATLLTDRQNLRQAVYQAAGIDSKGKRGDRTVVLYSHFVFLNNKKTPFCTKPVSMCDDNATELQRLIAAWSQMR